GVQTCALPIYGVLGLVSALLIKISLLASMSLSVAIVALIIGHTLSRLLCISLLALLPYGGEIEHAKAKPMAQQLTPLQGLLSSGWLILAGLDRKSTRLNSSHVSSSYAVFCLK